MTLDTAWDRRLIQELGERAEAQPRPYNVRVRTEPAGLGVPTWLLVALAAVALYLVIR